MHYDFQLIVSRYYCVNSKTLADFSSLEIGLNATDELKFTMVNDPWSVGHGPVCILLFCHLKIKSLQVGYLQNWAKRKGRISC